MRFNRRPIPFPDESRRGYLWRFAYENGFSSLLALIRHVNSQAPQLFSTEGLIQENLSENCGKQLLSITVGCHDRYMLKSHFRYCPICVFDHVYFKIAWDYALLPYCETHQIRLLTAGTDPIGLFERNRDQYKVHPQVLANQYAYSLQQQLAQTLDLSSALVASDWEIISHLSIDQLQRLIVTIGSYKFFAERYQPRKVSIKADVKNAESILIGAADVLAKWPSGICNLITPKIEKKQNNRRVRQSIGFLYKAVHKEFSSPAFKFFVDAFDQALVTHWPEVVDAKNPRLSQYQNLRQFEGGTAFSKRNNVSIETVSSLISEGAIDGHIRELANGRRQVSVRVGQDDRVQNYLASLDLRAASRQLGLPRPCVRELLIAGHIAGRAPKSGKPWRIRIEDLEDFRQRMRAGAVPGQPDTEHKTLEHLARFYLPRSLSIFDVMTGLLDGSIPYQYLENPGRRLLNSVSVPLHYITALSRSSNTLSIPALAKNLKVKQEVAYHLVNRGIIETKDSGRTGRFVTQGALKQFQQHHVWARDLAAAVQTSPRRLVRQLSTLPVAPTSGPTIDGGRQVLYQWKTLFRDFRKALEI